MPNERDILIRALEASGSQREADLAKAILPETPAPAATAPAAAAAPVGAVAPAAPAAPAAAAVPAEVAALGAERAAGPQPPPGKAPLQTIDEWEALPEKEQLARMPEIDQLLREEVK